jgi:dTDP-4-dehydrorhamnose reductase
MKVAVIGGNGQLGSDVARVFSERGDEVRALTHADIELESMDSVARCLESVAPVLVVNTAAMHHVDQCEQQPEKAFAVNAIGARNLAIVTRDLGGALIHISTDYVFDGRKGQPYVEDDAPLPVNVYGNTKLAGEAFVRTVNPRHFVLRVSAIYGKHPCRAKGGNNFVELMLKLGRERGKVRVVDSEVVSPSPTAQIAAQIYDLSRSDAYGLYHGTAEGHCSWYEFAREIFRASNMPVDVQIAGPNEFPAKTPRPAYSVLENRGLKRLGLNRFTDWKEGLQQYLNQSSAAVVT